MMKRKKSQIQKNFIIHNNCIACESAFGVTKIPKLYKKDNSTIQHNNGKSIKRTIRQFNITMVRVQLKQQHMHLCCAVTHTWGVGGGGAGLISDKKENNVII